MPGETPKSRQDESSAPVVDDIENSTSEAKSENQEENKNLGDKNLANNHKEDTPIINEKSNIAISEVDDDNLEILRGDAIGNTMYSESYILSTLIELTKDIDMPLSENEEFEKKLCDLWDMTAEEDVVTCLMKNDALDVFGYCITKYSDDDRLSEILVGIIANMACSKDAAEKLLNMPEIIRFILSSIGSTDALTLEQLMRFITTVISQLDNTQYVLCYEHFAAVPDFWQKFTFILSNCLNCDVLLLTMTALKIMLEKFDEYKTEIGNEAGDEKEIKIEDPNMPDMLVDAIIAAFDTYTAKKFNPKDYLELDKHHKTFIQTFLANIYYILDFDANIKYTVSKHSNVILNGLAQIVRILLMQTNNPLFDSLHEEIAEGLVVFNLMSSFQYHESCMKNALKLLFFIDDDMRAVTNEWESEANENNKYYKTIGFLIEYISSVFSHIDNEKLYEILTEFSPNEIVTLINSLNNDKDPQYNTKEICRRIRTVFEN